MTAGTHEEAQKVCTAAVQGRLAACAQILGPISSVYWWEGEVQADEEFLILMKTSKDRLDELIRVVKTAHSYDTPEIVAIPIEGGLTAYLNWITEETAKRPEGE